MYFQAVKYWYKFRILANPMNANGQMNIARIIQRASAAKAEKRRSFRLSLSLPMEYSFPESSEHRLACMVDLCEGGLMMHTAEKLVTGQSLRMKIFCDSAMGLDCIQATGDVIRVDKLGKSGKEYRCAVRFSDLSPEILKKLRKFLRSLY
jgi:c-di-GMP-binding flagellar brake protein YcgR